MPVLGVAGRAAHRMDQVALPTADDLHLLADSLGYTVTKAVQA
ncbi:hypothetical protein [Rhodococcus wratislaviensis]